MIAVFVPVHGLVSFASEKSPSVVGVGGFGVVGGVSVVGAVGGAVAVVLGGTVDGDTVAVVGAAVEGDAESVPLVVTPVRVETVWFGVAEVGDWSGAVVLAR